MIPSVVVKSNRNYHHRAIWIVPTYNQGYFGLSPLPPSPPLYPKVQYPSIRPPLTQAVKTHTKLSNNPAAEQHARPL